MSDCDDECDDRAPTMVSGVFTYCTRRYGHRGPHRDSGGMEWRSFAASVWVDPSDPSTIERAAATVSIHRYVGKLGEDDDPQGVQVDVYCSCGWHGGWQPYGESYGAFAVHVAAAVLASLSPEQDAKI